MNIDERLEALTGSVERLRDRQDALAQTVELLSHNVDGMRGLVNDIALGTARLLRVAEIHEHRLDSHDSRLDNLES